MTSFTDLGGAERRKLLTASEEHDLAVAWQEQGVESARTRIIQAHAKLVAREAARYRHYKAERDDLYSEGLLGLTIAIEKGKYDPYSGFRFSTYALHWIRAKMIAHIMATEGTLRVSSTARFKKLLFSYRQAAASIASKAAMSGSPLTREEVLQATAEKLGFDIEDIRTIDSAMAESTSLNHSMGQSDDGGDLTLGDLIADTCQPADEAVADKQIAERLGVAIADALAELKPREQDIIRSRKFADNDSKLTLEDLAHQYGVSRERIRQIETRALEKLQAALSPTRELLDV